MPDVKLPRFTGGYPEDAALQVRRAIEHHTPRFRPGSHRHVARRGERRLSRSFRCWPSMACAGSPRDEEILCQSTQGFISRDNHGQVRNPELLYRPYRVKEGDGELSIVFRDHALSDMIGFHYQRSTGEDAAEDFLRHLHDIRQAIGEEQTPLVNVILDGENCWEHYPDGGVPFLRALYRRCTQTAGNQAGQAGGTSGTAAAARHAAASVRRQLDQSQFRDLDRPRRGRGRPGTPCTGRANTCAAAAQQPPCEPGES